MEIHLSGDPTHHQHETLRRPGNFSKVFPQTIVSPSLLAHTLDTKGDEPTVKSCKCHLDTEGSSALELQWRPSYKKPMKFNLTQRSKGNRHIFRVLNVCSMKATDITGAFITTCTVSVYYTDSQIPLVGYLQKRVGLGHVAIQSMFASVLIYKS